MFPSSLPPVFRALRKYGPAIARFLRFQFSHTPAAAQLRAAQVSAVARFAPVTALAVVASGLAVVWIVTANTRPAGPSPASAWVWLGITAVAVAHYVHDWLRQHLKRRNCATPQAMPQAELRAPRAVWRLTGQSAFLATAWSFVPLTYLGALTPDVDAVIIAVCAAMLGVGSFILSSVPTAAIAYISILTGGLAISLAHWSSSISHLMLGLLCAYSATLAMIMVTSFTGLAQSVRNIGRLNERNETVRLLLRQFEDNAGIWLWETDVSGRLCFSTRQLAQVLGTSRRDMIGRNIYELLHHAACGNKDEAAQVKPLIDAICRRSAFSDIIIRVERNGDQRWLSLTACPKLDRNGQFCGFRGFGSDVTQQVVAESNLRAARATAEQGNSAKTQFLAMMSHELRTPLNAIIGFSETIQSETLGRIDNPRYIEYAGDINSSGRHLLSIINDLLDLSRIENGRIEICDDIICLRQLISETVKTVTGAATTAVATLTCGDIPDVNIRADADRLQQIMTNLLVNALKFTPGDGQVEVFAERYRDGRLAVHVRDTGTGIAPQDLERVFSPFEQAAGDHWSKKQGTGLGLAISRNLARAHGGELHLESQRGHGTTATLLLPSGRVIAADVDLPLQEHAKSDGSITRDRDLAIAS